MHLDDILTVLALITMHFKERTQNTYIVFNIQFYLAY